MVDFDEMGLYQAIGSRLRALRIGAGVSQTELAEKVGLLRTSISNIEAGRQKLNIAVIYKACIALNAEIIDLLPNAEQISGASPDKSISAENLPPKSAKALEKAMKNINKL